MVSRIRRYLVKQGVFLGLFNRLRKYYWDSVYQKYRDKYSIDKSFLFNGVDIEMYGEGEIIIGKNSYIGNRSVLAAVEGKKIIIGSNCSISHNVRIYTGNREPKSIINDTFRGNVFSTGDVIIGDNVWIGANVFIVQGVKIGKNCVIGANSVVTKNLDSYSIYGGVPAKKINLRNG